MSNEILYILLPDYAEHEAVYLSQVISADDFTMKENPKYINKVVSPTLEPVKLKLYSNSLDYGTGVPDGVL